MDRRTLTRILTAPIPLLAFGGIAQARTTGSGEKNKAITRLFVEEFFNKGYKAIADEVLTEHFVDHNLFANQKPGREGFSETFAEVRRSFPDFHVIIEDLIAEGDKVVMRSTWSGTHTGDDFMGTTVKIPPKSVRVSAIDIIRFDGDKAVERWGYEDDLGLLLQQLGRVLTPEPARK